jgi:hypothetical protein
MPLVGESTSMLSRVANIQLHSQFQMRTSVQKKRNKEKKIRARRERTKMLEI